MEVAGAAAASAELFLAALGAFGDAVAFGAALHSTQIEVRDYSKTQAAYNAHLIKNLVESEYLKNWQPRASHVLL